MYIVESYSVAVILTVITMLCWGSWANTQKLAAKTWRFELFYWDYVLGIVLFSLMLGHSFGTTGTQGMGFADSLRQADWSSTSSAIAGGVIFNLANILIVAAIAIAGMSVAFPVGIGIALVLGVIINYIASPQGDALLLFVGVALVGLAIVIDALAYRKKAAQAKKVPAKGIMLSVVGGVLMALFYRFVASSMATNPITPEAGKLTPYAAVFIFALGILISNFLINTVLMKRPVEGEPVTYSQYFKGSLKEHLTGILGGMIWCLGMSLSILAANKAGFAISYGLGQGATLIAALWGVFIWKEFKNSPKGVNTLLTLMFLLFVAGLGLIILAGS
jgi:glucose uptake protein